jgi:hypothetical protein
VGVGLGLLFEFDGGSREYLLFALSFPDRVNEEIATHRYAGQLLDRVLSAVGADRVDALAGKVVLVEREADGGIVAFEAPSFVPHAGRFDRRDLGASVVA